MIRDCTYDGVGDLLEGQVGERRHEGALIGRSLTLVLYWSIRYAFFLKRARGDWDLYIFRLSI